MNFVELISFSKVLNVAMGLEKRTALSQLDIEVVSEMLKRMADESHNWTHEQRGLYKLMVDAAKEKTKQEI